MLYRFICKEHAQMKAEQLNLQFCYDGNGRYLVGTIEQILAIL